MPLSSNGCVTFLRLITTNYLRYTGIYYNTTNALQCNVIMRIRQVMPPKKTATLNLRIDPSIKEAVKEAADLEHRSVANFVELLIRVHCEEAGITIPEQRELFDEDGTAKGKKSKRTRK